MGERKVYLYRLNVTLPPEAAEPGWKPDDWARDWDDDPNIGFQWPRNTLYLSATGARRRAGLFRKYGAQVTVERSAPVTWPEVLSGG